MREKVPTDTADDDRGTVITGTQKKTDVSYWAKRHSKSNYETIGGSWFFNRYCEPYMPTGKNKTCLEVGVCPGSNLLFLVQRYGYTPTGIDFSPFLSEVEERFRMLGIKGEFIHTDFLKWNTEKKFDVVISHGFIEHFENYQNIVNRHWEMVKNEGVMVLSVPVLSLLQRFIRILTYTSDHWQEILGSHNREIMNLKNLKRAVERCSGSEILVSRHVKWMTVWYNPDSDGVRRRSAFLFPIVRFMERIVRKLDISNGYISPEALVMARKRS